MLATLEAYALEDRLHFQYKAERDDRVYYRDSPLRLVQMLLDRFNELGSNPKP